MQRGSLQDLKEPSELEKNPEARLSPAKTPKPSGLWVWGLGVVGFWVCFLVFTVWGLGFRVFRAWGFGLWQWGLWSSFAFRQDWPGLRGRCFGVLQAFVDSFRKGLYSRMVDALA